MVILSEEALLRAFSTRPGVWARGCADLAMRERGASIAAVAAMPEVRRRLRRERMAAWEAESMVMPGLSFSAQDEQAADGATAGRCSCKACLLAWVVTAISGRNP